MSAPNDTARYPMAAWVLTAAVISLIGNTTVLLASLKYKALKLDKISVALIEHIAVADIATSLQYLVVFKAIISQHLIVNEEYCPLFFGLFNYVAGVGVLLVCALNVSKLTSILFPFLARLRSYKSGHRIAAVIWLSATPLILFIKIHGMTSEGNIFYFRQETYRCAPNFTNPTNKTAIPILITINVIIPVLIVMVCTVALLRFVSRSRGLALQSVVTVLSMSGIYLVSYIPYAVEYLLESLGIRNNDFTRFAVYVSCLNIIMNPFIYYFSVKSYGEFVRDLMDRMKIKIRCLCLQFYRLLFCGNGEGNVLSRAISRRRTI